MREREGERKRKREKKKKGGERERESRRERMMRERRRKEYKRRTTAAGDESVVSNIEEDLLRQKLQDMWRMTKVLNDDYSVGQSKFENVYRERLLNKKVSWLARHPTTSEMNFFRAAVERLEANLRDVLPLLAHAPENGLVQNLAKMLEAETAHSRATLNVLESNLEFYRRKDLYELEMYRSALPNP